MAKTLVIGLDGVPLDLVKGWMDEGKMPNLKRLLDGGASGYLQSTVPHTSGPAWTSFMTGLNPGKTGIYDFIYRKEGTYDFIPNTSRRRAGKAIWQQLSDAGQRVIVVNVPTTYPVDNVDGVMISGWLTPYSAKDFYHPPGFLEKMEAAVGSYSIYPLATFTENNLDEYMQASYELLNMLTDSMKYAMTTTEWDFAMVVFFDTDRILHQLWHYLDPEHFLRANDRHLDKSAPVRDYFTALDAKIGDLVATAGDDANVIIMSDHGMGATRKMLTLNTWLLEKGLIRLRRNPWSQFKHLVFRLGFTLRFVHRIVSRLGLAKHAEYKVMYSADRILKKVFLSFDDVDWSRTKAYSFGRTNGPVFLNLQGREPRGIVQPGSDYEKVRDEIAAMAAEMTDPKTGEKMVGKILKREEVYHGDYTNEAPDLLLEPMDDRDIFYGLSDFGANQVVMPMYRYTGMHRTQGMVVLHGPAFRNGVRIENANIMDLAPTILHCQGLPISDYVDGSLLEAALVDAARQGVRYVAEEADSSGRGPARRLTNQEIGELEDRLRQLGYLG